MSSFLKKEKRKQKNLHRRVRKLRIEQGDIVLFHTSDRSSAPTHQLMAALTEAGAGLVIILKDGETLESMAPQLFQHALEEHIGEKAAQVIMNYRVKIDEDRARSRAS